MSKFVDVSKLGEREVAYQETGTKVNEQGLKVLTLVNKTRMEAQPLLTKEEAQELVGADWYKMPDGLPKEQTYCCHAGGRRFFAEEIPVAKVIEKDVVDCNPDTQIATVNDGVMPLTNAEKSAVNRIAKKEAEGRALTAFEKKVKAKIATD